MEKYNKYKDSDIDWLLDEIPSHWETKRIKDLCKMQSGFYISANDFKDEGFPIYGGNGFRGFSEDYNHVGEYTLVGRQGALCGNINYAKGKFWATEHAIVVYEKNGVNKFWFGELLRLMNLNQYSLSAAQPGLSVEKIKRLKLPFIPSLEEQTQIATYLDAKTTAIDKKVNLLQQKIKHYKAYRKTLINETVTKGLDKTVKLKDSDISWIGLIPEHWEVNRMKKYFSIEKTKVGEFSSNFLLLSLTKKGVIPRDLEKNAGKFPAEFNTYQIVEPNDLIFCLFDLDVTPRTIGYSYHNGMITGAYTIIKSKKNIENKYYYYMYLSIDDSKNLSLFYTGLRNTIKKDTFISLPIPIPSKKEQTQIANYLDAKTATIDKILKNIETQITTLKELRKTLINEVVTGKVKVSA